MPVSEIMLLCVMHVHYTLLALWSMNHLYANELIV